jgi:hypothetical protein
MRFRLGSSGARSPCTSLPEWLRFRPCGCGGGGAGEQTNMRAGEQLGWVKGVGGVLAQVLEDREGGRARIDNVSMCDLRVRFGHNLVTLFPSGHVADEQVAAQRAVVR